jgi:hypothetical protein
MRVRISRDVGVRTVILPPLAEGVMSIVATVKKGLSELDQSAYPTSISIEER